MKLGSVLSSKDARQKSQLLPLASLSTSHVFRELLSLGFFLSGWADPPSDSLGDCDVYQINEFSSCIRANIGTSTRLLPQPSPYLWTLCLPFSELPHPKFFWSLDIKEMWSWVKLFWKIQTLFKWFYLGGKKQNNFLKWKSNNKRWQQKLAQIWLEDKSSFCKLP